MRAKTKIEEFFKKNGYYRGWYAEKLGMTQNLLWSITNGKRPIPPHHWDVIVEGFKGYVTYDDLIYDHIEHELDKIGRGKIKDSRKNGEFIVVVDTP